METWVFDRERLPVPLPRQAIEFRVHRRAPTPAITSCRTMPTRSKELDAVKKKYAGTEP